MITDGVCRGLLADAEAQALYDEAVKLVGRRNPNLFARGYLTLADDQYAAATTLEYGIADFALAYARQTNQDHEALDQARRSGRIKVAAETVVK